MHSFRLATPASALALIFSIATAACGASPEVSTESSDATEAAKLTFVADEDYSVEQSRELVEGDKLSVAYDADRLPDCRGDFNGKPAWTITGHYRLNDGKWRSFEAGGFSPTGGAKKPVLELDEAGVLSIYFEIGNRWGCHAYDSAFGENYNFDVAPASEEADGPAEEPTDETLGDASGS